MTVAKVLLALAGLLVVAATSEATGPGSISKGPWNIHGPPPDLLPETVQDLSDEARQALGHEAHGTGRENAVDAREPDTGGSTPEAFGIAPKVRHAEPGPGILASGSRALDRAESDPSDGRDGASLLGRRMPAFCEAWDDQVEYATLWLAWALHGAPETPPCPLAPVASATAGSDVPSSSPSPVEPALAAGPLTSATPADAGAGARPPALAFSSVGSALLTPGSRAHGNSDAAMPASTTPWLLIAVALAVLTPLVALYRRLTRSDVLDHPTRSRVLDAVLASPGATAGTVARLVAIDHSTALHHLNVLVEFGALDPRPVGARLRYYPRGAIRTDAERGRCVALSNAKARLVLGALSRDPRASMSQLARATGLAKSTVDWHVLRLKRLGVLGADGTPAAAHGALADARTA